MNNLSEEEKKAIEWLKKADWFSARLYSGTILNLIEKQQKEIEELKMKLEVEKIDNKYNKEEAYEEMIARYKIREKIEELEKEQEDNRKRLYSAVNNLYFKEIDKISDKICVNMAVRDILQSLLEEE